jgi:aconitate hydratase
VRILRAGGGTETLLAAAAVETRLEIRLLRMGGVIPAILSDTIESAESHP